MPAFLAMALGFSIEQSGVLCIFPYLALFFSSMVFGKLFDQLQQLQWISTRGARQYAEFLAIGTSSICLLAAGIVGAENRYLAYAFLVIGQVF